MMALSSGTPIRQQLENLLIHVCPSQFKRNTYLALVLQSIIKTDTLKTSIEKVV